MPKVFTSKSQKTGEVAEHIAVRYLEGKGFSIIERNYTKKCGEIDVVAKKADKIHFVEVKSKTVDFSIHVNSIDVYRPEDGMHRWKIERLTRTIQTYLYENRESENWQFDLITVYVDQKQKEAKVEYLDNLIL